MAWLSLKVQAIQNIMVKENNGANSLIIDIQQRIVALSFELEEIAEALEKINNQKVA